MVQGQSWFLKMMPTMSGFCVLAWNLSQSVASKIMTLAEVTRA